MEKILHIVFGESAGGLLKQAFTIDKEYKGEIICLNDDLSMGPISNLSKTNGKMARIDWWKKITEDTFYNQWIIKEIGNGVEIEKYKFIKANTKKQELCIWLGPDTVNRIGFMRLMYELKDTTAKILVMDYPFKKYKYPVGHKLFLGIQTLSPEQIVGMKKYIRNIKSTEKKSAIINWLEVSSISSTLRIVGNNEKIRHVQESFYDKLLLSNCTTEFSKAAFVIGGTLGELALTRKWVGDVYLNWRLKELVKSNKIIFEGSLTNILDFRVKLFCT